MDGAQRHDRQLLELYAHLKLREDGLLRDLAEVRREMDAVWRTASVELRERQAAASATAELRPMPSRDTAPPRHPFPSLQAPIQAKEARPDTAVSPASAGRGAPPEPEISGDPPPGKDDPFFNART